MTTYTLNTELPVVQERKPSIITMPIMTSLGVPVMPEATLGLKIAKSDRRLIRVAEKQFNGAIGFLLQRKDVEQNDAFYQKSAYYRMGTWGRILRTDMLPEDEMHVMCHTEKRILVSNLRTEKGVLLGDVTFPESIYPKAPRDYHEISILMVEIMRAMHTLAEARASVPDEVRKLIGSPTTGGDPGRLAEVAITMAIATPDEYQTILETLDVRERLEKVLFFLERDIDDLELRGGILRRVKDRMDKDHRNYVLREQLHEIKKELGEDLGSQEEDMERFQEKYAEIRQFLPEEADTRIREEIAKLKCIQPMSAEYTISKNYLDWLTGLPWGNVTDDCFEIASARRILERDHYGLEDVKKRILEFIAVAKLKNKVSGSILCLIGPPGVGKTSLGHSIAEALGRKFFRFSLGGMHDEAEIKGHRRTYIGAQPGKIISAIKTCGVKNPVIMLDEIDKLGASVHGDPASALLEVLDPEQNATFRDHFMDIPFDLSQVLFIATANVRDTIPAPLQDRMEIINLSGYIMDEKLNIAKRHLIPKQLPKNGLTKQNVSIPDATVKTIILNYARESGVRQLDKCIGTCMRKVAMGIAEGSFSPDKRVTVKIGDLENYLGKQIYYDDPLVKQPRPGVAMGLAWTAVGGTTLYIEVLPIEGKGEPVKVTGQLGDVMKESVQIAYSMVEAHTGDFGIASDFFEKHKLHVHVPAGATPKDGPSAGITIASAIISAATGKRLPAGWAMTGELTLTARVLPVGGIKEKVISAHRAGVRSVILPALNEKDFKEIHSAVRDEMTAHFVNDYKEVYSLLF